MPGVEAEKKLSAPAEALVKLACEELGEMSSRQRAEGLLAFNTRRSPSRRRQRLVLSLSAVVTAMALVVAGYGWLSLGQRGLSYEVEGGRFDPAGVLAAKGTAEPTLRFSDGTEVVFRAGSTGRLKSVGEHGARISLTGKIDVKVVSWRGAHWLFDAGPFLITVTGTAFTAEWRETDQRLEIALRAGGIAVSGPLSDDAITLRAGQRLIISAREKEVLIREIDATTEADKAATARAPAVASSFHDAPQDLPARPDQRSEPSTAGPTPGSGPTASNWRAELAAGHFATIVQQAEQRGIDKVIAEVSSDDLAALSDAARYSRMDDVARRALVAQRRRFPQSVRANDAAFLLGRLEETAGRSELALDWYERCLGESPQGSYVADALGRKMKVVQRLHGAARARPIAEEYLRRFGNGTYAAAARALLRAP